MSALAQKKAHVPYRNSKLTHLLMVRRPPAGGVCAACSWTHALPAQDSLGGNAKTLLVVCVSPTVQYLTETLRCLAFGERAMQVVRGRTVPQGPPPEPAAAGNTFVSPYQSPARSARTAATSPRAPRRRAPYSPLTRM